MSSSSIYLILNKRTRYIYNNGSICRSFIIMHQFGRRSNHQNDCWSLVQATPAAMLWWWCPARLHTATWGHLAENPVDSVEYKKLTAFNAYRASPSLHPSCRASSFTQLSSAVEFGVVDRSSEKEGIWNPKLFGNLSEGRWGNLADFA